MALFLQEDILTLREKIKEIEEKIHKLAETKGIVANQGAETWHDNAPFEEAEREQIMWSARLRELNRELTRATIVDPPKEKMFVALGHSVTLLDLDTRQRETLRIGSHLTFSSGAISYDSPLGEILLGKRVGGMLEWGIDSKKRRLLILEIS